MVPMAASSMSPVRHSPPSSGRSTACASFSVMPTPVRWSNPYVECGALGLMIATERGRAAVARW